MPSLRCPRSPHRTQSKWPPENPARFKQVEAAMRDNAKALDQTIASMRQNRAGGNAIQRLESREQFAKMRSENDSRFLAVFKPLYASLSSEQQRMADQLIGSA